MGKHTRELRLVGSVPRRELLKMAGPAASLAWLGGALEARGKQAPEELGNGHCQLRLFLGDAAGLDAVLEEVRGDIAVRDWIEHELQPLLVALPDGLAATPPPMPGPLPVADLTAEDESFLRSFVESMLPSLIAHGPDGPPPDRATIDRLIDEGIVRVSDAMAAPDFDAKVSLANQAADFNAAVVSNIYVAVDQSAQSLILLSPAGKVGEQDVPKPKPKQDTLTDEQLVIVVSLLVELLGLLIGLAGLLLPKVPLGPLANAVLPSLKSPTVRNLITKLLETLSSKTATLLDKAEAIADFLTGLAALGVISVTVSEMLKALTWVDYLRLAVQVTLLIAVFVVTGGSSLVAKVGVALTVSLAEILEKVRKIVADS